MFGARGQKPNRLFHDPRFDRHRAAVFYLVVGVFCTVDLLQLTLTISQAPGFTEARLIGVAALFMFLGFLIFYKVTKRLKIASAAVLIAAYVTSVFAALKQGGAPAPTLTYVPFLPLVTTVLLGRRAGVIALIASVGSIVYCTWAAGAGVAQPSPHTEDGLRLLISSASIFLAVGVTLYAATYENLINAAMSTVDDAKKELETQADALVRSREFLTTVMDATHDGIVAANADGTLNLFNRAARELHGLDAIPLDFKDWPETYSLYEADGKTPLTPERVTLYRALKGEKIVNEEMAVSVPGKEIRYILSTASPLHGKDGELLGALTTLREITKEKAQEEQIRKQNREIDQFARVASVDLQAPLNRIVKTSEALLKCQEVSASAHMRHDLASVSAAAKKMGALIKDVLYMSRLPIGEIALQPVLARDCIEAAIDRAEINEADCRLDFRFSGSPDVMADPNSLTLVFKNLIENAWKHAAANGRAHVEFTCTMEQDAAVLGVKDNGEGMSAERIERLFSPLDRVRTEDGLEGTGLGLAICRESIARMGGEFWIESAPGEGCHCRLRMPLAQKRVPLAS